MPREIENETYGYIYINNIDISDKLHLLWSSDAGYFYFYFGEINPLDVIYWSNGRTWSLAGIN